MSRPAGRPWSFLFALWVGAGLLIFLTWWHVFSLVSESYAREQALAERDLANITRLSQEHVTRTLGHIEQVIQFVQSRYLERADRLDLKSLVAQNVRDAAIFTQVRVMNAQGLTVLSDPPMTASQDVSGLDYFKIHAGRNVPTLYISQPQADRAGGLWSLHLSRRLSAPDGSFAGVIVVSIDPAYFTRFYAELKLGQQGLIALYGLDGVARARKVGRQEAFGAQALTSQLFTRLANAEISGAYINRSVVDSVERLYHYRKIPAYPLVVIAGLDTQDVFVNHWRTRHALWLQAALVSLLLLALAAVLHRHLRLIQRKIAASQSAQLLTQERTEQLNAIFALSPDGFISFDLAHRVNYVSPAFGRMFALSLTSLKGMDETAFSAWLAARCITAPTFSGIAHLRAKITPTQPDVHEIIEISNEGKRILQVGLRCSESRIVSQILYFRDVTAETEVDQMKSEFLSTAAHELRTPMASILGFAEVLLTQELDVQTQQEFLNIIYEQSKLMANILDELLNLARIEARRSKDFNYTQVNLQTLLSDIVKAFKRPTGREAAQLLLPASPLCVTADAGKLQQAIVNVLSNAYKYSPAGGPVVIELAVKTEAAQAPRAEILISDQGIGMTPAQLSRVCERFYRADTSGKIPGTGLGMSIVKEIIELHRGDLSIVSTPGQGTRVSLSLPMS